MKIAGERSVGATAWDYASAAMAEAAGADIVLVGDSLSMTIRGDEDTLAITLEDMLYHTKMVAGACNRALVVGDMPFMSYQVNAETALISAGRFLKEGRARAVKIEGGRKMAGTITRVTEAGIPVMGHIGLTPQSVHQLGGFKVQGKALGAAKELIADSKALVTAGVFAIVLECVPASLAAYITGEIDVPTIGIGAGADCDGQIQVTADLVGLNPGFVPKHAKRYANINRAYVAALRKYAKEVKEGAFPTADNAFEAGPELDSAIDKKEL